MRYRLAGKNLEIHTCPVCDTEFETALKRQKYCSSTCRFTRDKRAYKEKYIPKEYSKVHKCSECDTEFTTSIKKQKYCSVSCRHTRDYRVYNKPTNRVSAGEFIEDYRKPTHELNDADLAVIQLIWHTFDYFPLSIFPDFREARAIHDSLLSKEMFHEWAVYTIIFQAHMMWSYEMIVQTPGLVKADFLRLCKKYRITLQDSEAFAGDIKAVG